MPGTAVEMTSRAPELARRLEQQGNANELEGAREVYESLAAALAGLRDELEALCTEHAA